MSKVLITYERGNNTTDVNLASFRLLFSHMSIQWREKKTTLVSHSDLLWCDVCLAIRPNSVYSQRIAEVAKKTGIFYIVSFDEIFSIFLLVIRKNGRKNILCFVSNS